MSRNRLALLSLAAAATGVVLAAAGVLQFPGAASALFPAQGTDTLKISAEIDVTSRLGSETIVLAGTATVDRSDPVLDNGVQVVDMTITDLALGGSSSVGAITVTESATTASTGELRSLQPSPGKFPASSFFDVFVTITAPESGGRYPPTLRNLLPFHVANETDVMAWPPVGLTFSGDQSGSGDCFIDDFTDVTVPPPPGGGILLVQPSPSTSGAPACAFVTRVSISFLDGTATPTVTSPPPTLTSTRTPTHTRTPTATRTPTQVPWLYGDANCLNGVDSIDALLVLQFVADLLSKLQCPQGADADAGGGIDSIDSLLILQYVADLIDQLPPGGPPTSTPTDTPPNTSTATATRTPTQTRTPTATLTPPGGTAIVALAGCTASAVQGTGHGTDDGSSGVFASPFSMNFFGTTYNSIFVNNNGNITFDSPLGSFDPDQLSLAGRDIIAPFMADVDTRPFDSGITTYGNAMYQGRQTLCVNWYDVGYYDTNTDKKNQFQLLLVDRADVSSGDFDIVINYDQVEWEAGDANFGTGGVCSQQSCDSARAGYSDGTNFFEIAGSSIHGCFLDSSADGLIQHNINSAQTGRYIFEVRDGIAPTQGSVPTTCLAGGP